MKLDQVTVMIFQEFIVNLRTKDVKRPSFQMLDEYKSAVANAFRKACNPDLFDSVFTKSFLKA